MLIVIDGVDGDMVRQTLPFFSRTPGLSDQSCNVRSQHRAGVIEAEDGVEPYLFEFSLSCDRSPLPYTRLMDAAGKKGLHIGG
ncbi:MAG: hypothetical protein KF799_16230, partial [Bdellovibrionales bacterium]|nr:hypothetical protein [Bdellovibrionales bacterium]